MTMHLMGPQFTTTSTRKRKQNKKSASLLEAERQHAKFLKKMGYIGDKCSGSTASSNLARVGSTPTSPANKRSVAQPGSASALGAEGQRFESFHSDQIKDIGR